MFPVAGVPIEQYEQYARYVHNLDECCQLSSGAAPGAHRLLSGSRKIGCQSQVFIDHLKIILRIGF